MAGSSKSSAAALPIAGLALTHAWILAPYLSGSLYYICFHLGFAAALVACAIAYRRHDGGGRADAALPWLAACLMCAGTAAVFATEGRVAEVEGVFGALGGAGSAYCFARWFQAYCLSFEPKEAIGSTLLAFALSGLLRLGLVALQGASPAALPFVLAALPFCSAGLLAACCARERGAAAEREAAGRSREAVSRGQAASAEPAGGQGQTAARTRATGLARASAPGAPSQPAAPSGSASAPSPSAAREGAAARPQLLPVAVELALYGLVFGTLRNGMSEWSAGVPSLLIGHLLRIAIPLLLYWWLRQRASGDRAGAGPRAALLALVVAVLAVVFFSGLQESAASAIVMAARSFVSVLIYVRLFDIAYRTGAHPCAVYGTGRAVYELGLVAGLALYDSALAPHGWGVLPTDVAYFVVSCVLLVMVYSFLGAMRLPVFQAGGRAPEPPAVETVGLDEACGRVAREFGLSEREEEVMRLVCRGHTKRRIADTLGISEDTVRYHVKALYRKLGVHSRQELLDVVGVK